MCRSPPRVVLSCCLLFLPVLVLCADPSLNDDVLGLIVFKADLQDPTGRLASWNEDDRDPCGWSGVRCDPRTGRVVELLLDGFSLSGKIGRGLFQLQSLQTLSLSRNNLSGSLTPFTKMENLREVDLSENSLSGTIPDEFFSQCKSLRSVSLAKNSLSGGIPPSLGSCSTLASLNLSSNQLSGSLPGNLWWLNALRTLDLSFNLLSGEIPPGIEKMYNLRTISLRGNRLSGSLPDGIGGCLLLKSLDLGENQLSGNLPMSMRKLSLCNAMRLGMNSFSGELPAWIDEMSSLEALDLSSNGFVGAIPGSIGNLHQLKELDVSGNGLTGSVPETITGCRALLEVDFSDNSLTGELPQWIFELGLQQISLSGNKLTGSLQIPNPVSHALQAPDSSNITFSDGLPVGIASIRSLRLLNLSRNSFSGPIPASIGDLAAVEILDLSENRYNGSIPPEIGGAVALRELRLQKNSLSGRIPSQIENCTFLSVLILSMNQLSGSIPPNLANLTNLQVVDISRNRLSGTLPKQLGDLPHLVAFNISHNLFSGDLPSGNFFNTIPPSSVSGNPSLCGSAVNSSCPAVLPKPIVLDPSSSSSTDSTTGPTLPTNARHKKIILSISALVAIAAAALITVGVAAVTVLNLRVLSAATVTNSAAALALSDDYLSGSGVSPSTGPNSGKLVMFSGADPEFSAGAHAVLNKDCELGRGGFGAVYKTILRDGRQVAIKKLTVSGLVKSQDDFQREVKKLGQLRHPNLVAMEGFYWTPSLQFLIYEYVPCGSLHSHLHSGDSAAGEVLSWRERFDIVAGIAKGLAHLHRCSIIHYNVKSSNVLIDGAGEAKVGDYGLAKLLPMLDRYVLSSKVQSALGYVAPELASHRAKITDKCDVYGFGVLVLEIVTGRKPVEYADDDVVVLSDVARGALEEGRVVEVVDWRLKGRFPPEEAAPLVKLGLICTSHVPSNRPEMAEVVGLLEMIRCSHESSSCSPGDESAG
ncbi:unnamed protein product [Spirodela intermedia]|uniref:Protein kinase domain-containing protein n=1 Tax=Spirodela intermedia TaxID=51605 RepID=A0A7I8KLR6_SPIIN|nr:unnamed protein product [Spirodela intermedia]